MENQTIDHLPIGTLLQGGKYRIERFIAKGGFGCTYEAVHTMMNTRVAVKEFFVSDLCNRNEDSTVSVGITSKTDDFNGLKKSFVKEAVALFKMQNHHIVRVTDVFEEYGTAFYVMDYIDGQSLQQILSLKGKLNEQEALGYIYQICDALKYVHSQNRMHMDIKPGNIIVDGSGNAVLIDFGASKYYDEKTGEQTSTLMGIYTKGYAPVEQISKTISTFNPPTDIYALGATLYKLLSGITPTDALALAVGGQKLPPLQDNISYSTRMAVEKALKPNSKDRPQTIEEFVNIIKGGQKPAEDVSEVTTIDIFDKDKVEEVDKVEESEDEKTTLTNSSPQNKSKNTQEKENKAYRDSTSKHKPNSHKTVKETPNPEPKSGPSSSKSNSKLIIGAAAAIIIAVICWLAFGGNKSGSQTDMVLSDTINYIVAYDSNIGQVDSLTTNDSNIGQVDSLVAYDSNTALVESLDLSSQPQQDKEVKPVVTQDAEKAIEKSVANTDKNNAAANSTGILNLGYGTWEGGIKNGKPDGKGRLTFTSAHAVDRRSSVEANSGDYFDATYDNGSLISGKLYDRNGKLLKTIIP